jgi:hypothetical protein
VQPANPLAIDHVGLGPARRMLGLPRIDQQHFEAATRQQIVQGDPVHAGRFHGHRRHAAHLQPVGDGFQIGGVGAELAHPRRQLRVGIDEARRHVRRRHRHEMLPAMHVDSRRMPMRDDQIALGGRTPLLACAGLSDTTNLFVRTRHDVPSFQVLDTGVTQEAASAGGRTENRLPNGDRPRSSGHSPRPRGEGLG